MKKLLFVFAIAAFAAACGSGSNADTVKDSTVIKDSTTMMAPAPADTTHVMDTTHKDTLKK